MSGSAGEAPPLCQPQPAAVAAPSAQALAACRAPLISLHALQRARTTLEDFALSYLPMHGLTPQEGLLRFLDVLVFTSAALCVAQRVRTLALR
jgi:hypothetical protein